MWRCREISGVFIIVNWFVRKMFNEFIISWILWSWWLWWKIKVRIDSCVKLFGVRERIDRVYCEILYGNCEFRRR